MRLRSQLHFTGNRNNSEISFHIVGSKNKDMVIEVDDYDKIWEYLVLLHNGSKQQEIEKWMVKHQVSEHEKKEIDSFLYENGMADNLILGHNMRLDNFFSNYLSEQEIIAIREKCDNECALIIGLGTVGNAVVSYLHQMGIKRFVLVDDDIISERNLSHQRHYYRQDIGKKKCEVMKSRLLDIDSSCDVAVYNMRICNIEDFVFIMEKTNISVVFCCFDKHTGMLLKEMHSYLLAKNIDMYLSGYALSAVKAFKITDEVITENIEFEKTFTDVITDNAGIGIQGDLAAFLMVRLWMQKMNPFFELQKESMFYDFLSLKSEEAIGRTFDNVIAKILTNPKECKCIIENVIFPYALEHYVQYLCDDDNNLLEIEEWCEENGVDIFDKEDDAIQRYQESLEEMRMNYCGEQISILEFGQHMLGEQSIDEGVWNDYKEAQKPIIEVAINNLIVKKRKYIDNYKKIWEEKADIKESLLFLAKSIAKRRYKNEMDFLEYKPYSSNKYINSIEKDFKLIQRIDMMNAYFDYTGFVNYCLKHSFIHFVKGELSSACVRNLRYGTSDIIVARKGSWQDVFDLVHEIGHGYYNSFFNKNIQNVDEMTSEVFSLMSEYRLMKCILADGRQLAYYDAIKYRIQSILIGLFSLDLYEEGVLKLESITLDSILMTRRQVNESIFDGIELQNDTYSEYNMFMNAEMVAGQRCVYLYPEALLHAVHLGNMIEQTSSVEMELIQYLKEEVEEINILRFYSRILNEKPNYNKMASEVLGFWDCIDG